MRKSLIPLIVLFIILSVTLISCDDSTVNPPVNRVGSYDNSESQQCMTLSALAYVNENNPAYIKDSLIIQLADSNYATGGNWKLAWGPALNSDQSNMMYVVKDTIGTPDKYAIAIRGTDWCFFFDLKEDASIIEFDAYPFGGTNDSVSHGALYGLNQLLTMTDPVTNQTLTTYLNNIETPSNIMYITGHSLGGQLATIMSSWFLDNGYGSRFSLKAYTYAAPSTGNQAYADHYKQIFDNANAVSYRVFNSKDLVPNFCATLTDVIVKQIPTSLPYSVDATIFGLQTYLIKYDLIYKNAGISYDLGTINADSCNYAPGSLDQYECWVAFEHNTNTYLTLLNAPLMKYYTDPCSWKTNP